MSDIKNLKEQIGDLNIENLQLRAVIKMNKKRVEKAIHYMEWESDLGGRDRTSIIKLLEGKDL